LTCEVFDTGLGMSPDDCSRLFEPFNQADSSTTRPFQGTGLGLTISRHLASLMGGDLTVESQLGKGSVFRLTVPAASEAEVKERTPRPVLQGQSIAVLDSHDAFVDFVRTVVAPLGGQVLRAADEAEARQLAADGGLLVLLADHEFGELIASPPAGVPLVPTGHQERTTLAGLPSLSKPLRASRLAEVLALCLAKTTDGALSAGEVTGPRSATGSLGRWQARVLVVDDNESNRSVARLMLERLGCRVDAVDNGFAALDHITTNWIDLLFLDCSMPGLDGYETARRLRALDTPGEKPVVVAMTAFAMPEDRQRCLDAGMDDYVSKPVGLETMRRVLKQHLGAPEDSGEGPLP
jgi:two-component system sensor histidine kinase/response regulator